MNISHCSTGSGNPIFSSYKR